ncbi:carbohydrate porin [Solitalea koreensis]|uniref:Maltoporin n=1 Tax=Solitalea koreensis TaxID=543615 RepID=A0A521C4C4_9SPHI|nr:carbohydrate porin [Solitalea koreensis]SMO53681.1 maltoporin [Solitalea koreensis]
MKKHYLSLTAVVFMIFCTARSTAQTTFNKLFSFGSYGRVGAGFSPDIKGNIGRSFNLNGMGSIGGRMEEADYVELLTALHFKTENEKSDTTQINVQARMALYSSKGQLIGNVNSSSFGGITIALPEIYAEFNTILGSKWSAWIGSKYFRFNDVHIADHFYFDDHSAQGFGVSYKNTTLAVLFPGTVDTSNAVPPNFYVGIIDGTQRLGLRSRGMAILEHTFPFNNNKQSIKLLGEYHRLADASAEDTATAFNYPAASGWVLGLKHVTSINSAIKGSFNQVAIRYGHGIANGNDGGNSKTWLTYGAPDLQTNKFNKAYCISFVDHFLFNVSPKYSINAYALYTKSHGAADSDNKALDYYGRELFNRKTEYAIGARNFWYIKNWLHLIAELHYTNRKDGIQSSASMTKFSLVPTIVPTAKADPWARPHFRLIYSVAKYNQFAADNLYSPFLTEVGSKKWGHYLGVRAEWWLF